MINDDEAHLPPEQQEIDCSHPLKKLDAREVSVLVTLMDTTDTEAVRPHVRRLLEIVEACFDHDKAEVAFRCWLAYAAGYRGSRALTCGITALDYWYQVGRAERRTHDAFVTPTDS